ncbi:MAG TPA: alpha/beta hydrolase [Ornithinibacter sp.]|nr:alpha/beta hydrolase [Ornithinibacter sp.]
MRSYRGMSPLVTLLALAQDLRDRPVEELDADGIQEARAAQPTTTRVGGLLAGGVDRAVGITYGTAPARDDHEIPLRIYRPRALRDSRTDVPVVMWFHGGGWVLGGVLGHDPICTHLAARVGCLVVSVDYRLAPEHRAPTAALDCVDATTWVRASGEVLRADTSRMAVAGDSAGGNLAAVVAQVLRDHGIRLSLQALVYPVTDLTLSSPSVTEHATAPRLTSRSMEAFRDHYAGPVGDLRDPLLSPLHGHLEGLPAALVQTADLDPLRDDGIRYAAALRDAGVRVRLTNYLGVPHGFLDLVRVSPAARQQRWELVAELASALGTSGRRLG